MTTTEQLRDQAWNDLIAFAKRFVEEAPNIETALHECEVSGNSYDTIVELKTQAERALAKARGKP